jgi:hypothetical protein
MLADTLWRAECVRQRPPVRQRVGALAGI